MCKRCGKGIRDDKMIREYISELKLLLEHEKDRPNKNELLVNWYENQIKKFEEKLIVYAL